MRQALIITFTGTDRTGFVEDVAKVVEQHGGTWAGSRMSHLAGQFAGVALIHCPAEQTQTLTSALEALTERGITLHITPDHQGDAATRSDQPLIFRLTYIGIDRAGLVRQVTAALSRHHVNVERLLTDVSSAPMTGDPLFTLDATLTAPPGTNADELRDALEAIGHELHLDATLELIDGTA